MIYARAFESAIDIDGGPLHRNAIFAAESLKLLLRFCNGASAKKRVTINGAGLFHLLPYRFE